MRSWYEVSVAFRPTEAAMAVTGYVPSSVAPFRYIFSRPPGTFEITRFASGGVTRLAWVAVRTSATPSTATAYIIAASFDIERSSSFAFPMVATTCAMRSVTLASCSPRCTNIAEAFVAASVSPSSRSDIGHMATRRCGNARPVSLR